MTTTNDDLVQRIEQLIEEHIAASRRCAEEAVARAFATTHATPRNGAKHSRRPGKKRASADIAALGERFYEAVCAKPGETMTVLAAEVGSSARALNRSTLLLKRAGRVRTVGSRHLTRYFPMNGASS